MINTTEFMYNASLALQEFNIMPSNLTCEATLQTFLDSTSEVLNWNCVFLFVSYAIINFVLQYSVEKKYLTKNKYFKLNHHINNVYVAIAIIIFTYSWLVA